MHIVMVGPFGLRQKSTMRLRALPLARALVSRGHRVTVLIPPWDSPQDARRHWFDAGVHVMNTDLPRTMPGLFHARITWRLVTEVLRLQPDVVHAFKPKAYAGLTATVLWWLRRLGGCNVRLVIDTDDWEGAGGWNEILPYSPAQRRFFAWQEQWGLTHCDAVTVASKALQTLAWGRGVAPEHVFYVPNGVDRSEVGCDTHHPAHTSKPCLERIGGPQDAEGSTTRYRILLYTRFVEFKVERLIDIWQRVVEAVPHAVLIIVGQGLQGEEQRLLRLAQQGGMDETISYLGWPGSATMPGLFAAADLAIMPFDDTLVNRTKCTAKLVELMAAGLPIVADAVGQNMAYIEAGISGILVDPHDTDAFAASIIALLNAPDRRRRLGWAAQQRIFQHFTWERLVPHVEQAYQTAMP